MKVKKKTLLLIACFVWIAAGFNIARIGILAYPAYVSVLNFILSAAVFAIFQKFIDLKAFIIMAVMMTGGIYLRVSGLAPDRFIAVFYSGLGVSLLLAGVLFGWNYCRVLRKNLF